ncbi:MAG: hypothetical protein KJ621_05130 [Proteobacteria bacterium]|nr:hypothetical protein [Pseudomonadota bacterium]
MTGEQNPQQILRRLLDQWPVRQRPLRQVFAELTGAAIRWPDVAWTIIERAGISFSWRARLDPAPEGRTRPVFFLIDIIISDSEPWWLSVCFYEDEVIDPAEAGNAVPQGLFEETGYCFDVEDFDREQTGYLSERVMEAFQNAGGVLPQLSGPPTAELG